MKFNGKNLELLADHECNWCHQRFAFYTYKKSRRYIWMHCLRCDFDVRIKRSDKNLTYFKNGKKMQLKI
jgi:hypothetical protein